MLGKTRIYSLNFSSFSMLSFYGSFIIFFKLFLFLIVKSKGGQKVSLYKSGSLKGDGVLKPSRKCGDKMRGLV